MRYVLALLFLACLISLAVAPNVSERRTVEPAPTPVVQQPEDVRADPGVRPPPKVTLRTFTDEQVQRYVNSHPVTWIEEGQMYRVRSWVVFRRDDGMWEAHWTGWE